MAAAFSKLLSGLPPKGISSFSASFRLDRGACAGVDIQAGGRHTGMGPTWQAGALVGGVPRRAAGASVLAGRRAAGHVEQLTVRAGVGGTAGAAVGADLVVAGAPVAAQPGVLAALVNVLPAGGAVEARRAAADV